MVEARVATPEEIEAALNKYYGGGGQRTDCSVSKMIQDITEGEVEIGNVGGLGGAMTARRSMPMRRSSSWSITLIVEAFKMRASDIHLEPLAKTFRVALPHRRRVARDEEPAQAVAGRHHQPPEDPVEHVHRGAAHSAGRTYPDRRSAARSIDLACFLPAHEPWRKHRHAYSGQGRLEAWACRNWAFSRTTSRRSSG